MRWPSFLYDEKTHVKGKMRTGLFRSRFLLQCLLLIFCGPSAADNDYENGTQSQGTPPLVQRHNIKTITAEHLVYVACLARFLLSSAPRWKDRDGPWVGKEFADSLLHLLYRNTTFMNETLDWYDKQVFKNRFDEDEYGSDCEAAMLLVEEEEEHAQEEQRKLDAHIAREKRKEAAKARAAQEDDTLPVDDEQGGALPVDGEQGDALSQDGDS
ncbi:hypothetical protein K466DRAFT_604510 [Polyporus arcularius HHB13444]|uniref:Uncharacterized protein n=1 Tax=Polyporus arcularius HHB13444 TaxID=1314778 RepID=A0A5C3NVR4_9APHY|nr:hypothetical protein K466DRAFT_604510 [Polyporus arcularius HHB13444]